MKKSHNIPLTLKMFLTNYSNKYKLWLRFGIPAHPSLTMRQALPCVSFHYTCNTMLNIEVHRNSQPIPYNFQMFMFLFTVLSQPANWERLNTACIVRQLCYVTLYYIAVFSCASSTACRICHQDHDGTWCGLFDSETESFTLRIEWPEALNAADCVHKKIRFTKNYTGRWKYRNTFKNDIDRNLK